MNERVCASREGHPGVLAARPGPLSGCDLCWPLHLRETAVHDEAEVLAREEGRGARQQKGQSRRRRHS